MCEVLRSNFDEHLPNVLSNIDKAAFVAIDTEFTGLQGSLANKASLFDNGEERYQVLKKSTSNYIICQIGLSVFVPVENNSYESYTYNFYICPLSHGVSEEFFSCQASSLEFLCEHGFDFNKFVYEGIPYVNEERESQLERRVAKKSFLAAVDRNIDERLVQEYCSNVASWILSAKDGETTEVDVGRRMSPYTLHAELRQRFANVWSSDLGQGKVMVEKMPPETRAEREKTGDSPERLFLNSVLGFTKVFRHLVKAQKPLVGHNMLLDLLMMYKQFYQPLPKTLNLFKKEIHKIFPIIYDTKHIFFELGKEPENTGLMTAQSLQDLYSRLSSKKWCFVALYSPGISHGEGHDRYKADSCPHEAGYDAYIAGYVFLRLSHIKAMSKLKSTMMKPLTPAEHLAALKDLGNRINIIRAQINYIKCIGGHWSLTEANYSVAVDVLKERFGRKELVVDALLTRLLQFPSLRGGSLNLKKLRDFYDECEARIRSLKSLGVESNSYGCLLCPVLIKMLPEEIMLEWSRQSAEDFSAAGLDKLLQFVKKELESREWIAALQGMVSPVSKPTTSSSKPARQGTEEIPSSSALVTTATGNRSVVEDKKKEPFCFFCRGQNHWPDACKRVTSIPERREMVKKQGRCFLCLGLRHVARTCRSQRKSCSNCSRQHHNALCENDSVKGAIETKSVSTATDIVSANVVERAKGEVLLQTLIVTALGVRSACQVNCLIDGGSQRSFVRLPVVELLEIPCLRKETLGLTVFGSEEKKLTVFPVFRLNLKNQSTHEEMTLDLLGSETVCRMPKGVPGGELRRKLEESDIILSEIPEEVSSEQIDILIGADFYWKIVTGKTHRVDEALRAVETHFGWTIHGSQSKHDEGNAESATMMLIGTTRVDETPLDVQLCKFWEVDSMGTEALNQEVNDEDPVLKQFKKDIVFLGDRYEVKFPWKEDCKELGSNWKVAYTRFRRLLRRLEDNPEHFHRYDDAIREYMRNGHAEPVDESVPAEKKLFYLPHHAVIREDRETTKVRVVFDASSHSPGELSLNDCLFAGPNLNPDILQMLLRFRVHKIAMMSDIEKAFLQISLARSERDATRFLWVPEDWKPGKGVEVAQYRMTRVLFGASSSPFLLAATVRYHLGVVQSPLDGLNRALANNFYVDDSLSGAGSVSEAQEFRVQAQDLMQKGGMNLRKWVTNSEELRQLWREGGQTDPQKAELKVLGQHWNSWKDLLDFNLAAVIESSQAEPDTKRGLLKVASRIYDPFGLLTPFMVRVKCLFQEAWILKVPWDEKLPETLLQKWQRWKSELVEVGMVALPRFHDNFALPVGELHLHIFNDASELAYGAVAYLRQQYDGSCEVSFVVSKGRVAPVKKVTLPRLELLGAVLAVRLSTYVRDALSWEGVKVTHWTDSKIALQWIMKSSERRTNFVKSRVTEIRKTSDLGSWRFCPGNDNPADKLTRGVSGRTLRQDAKWWRGPEWLSQSKESWPQLEIETIQEATLEEIVASVRVEETRKGPEELLLSLDNYSKMSRVLRVTAWIRRFGKAARKSKTGSPFLTTEELQEAERFWIQKVQRITFEEECKALEQGKSLPLTSALRVWQPFLDAEGLLRVGGRLQFADLTDDEKHPIILPSDHQFTKLWVLRSHERILHGGIRDTLTEVRSKLWIPRARQVVKRWLRKCLTCQRSRAKASQEIEAPLPRDRIFQANCFEVTGLDFAGPLYVRVSSKVQEKCYIVLFTCMVIRAVHLELVSSQSAEHFLLALRRFVARRGTCRIIYSDNAKTFKKADRSLQKMWKVASQEEVMAFYGRNGITWKYIVERAAWWGGAWERMVQTVKRCLRKILGRASLEFEEMTTTLTEVEAVVNSRPITYLSDDPTDFQCLTPSHFLVGQRICSLPRQRGPADPKSERVDLTRRWKYRQRLMDAFWRRWKHEYLMELRSAHAVNQPDTPRALKVGELVLMKDDRQPRHLWKVGRIQELKIGRDKVVRSCVLRMPNGNTLRRPVQLLFRLEV